MQTEPDKLPDPPRQTAWRTLAGLTVLWLCLVLLFKAHTISDHPDGATGAKTQQAAGPLPQVQ